MSVRLPRGEVRGLDRRPAGIGRMLQLGWLCKLPEPETMPVDELKGALEGRGYALDAGGRAQPVALDALLPPAPEPEPVWLARRAASELAVDQDLRFLRFQDTVLPDSGRGGCRPGRAFRRRSPSSSDFWTPIKVSRLILFSKRSRALPPAVGPAPL